MSMRGLAAAALLTTGALLGAAGMMVHLGHRLDLNLELNLGKFGVRDRAEPVTVVMSRDGGHVLAGPDDARKRSSSSLANRGLPSVDLQGFRGSDKQWNRLLQCVRDRYADFNVTIVDEAPARGDYVLAMIGGPPSQLELERTVGGLAPHNGDVIPDAVFFVFQTRSTKIRDLCQTTAHEIGHTLGLDHTRLCSDIMSYERCGPKRFRDEHARCGEWDDRDCDLGHSHQNSEQALARAVGYRETPEAGPVTVAVR